ncbi:MAG: ADP-ribosylglycohydrolase family protein [Candidatus Eremiobacteraeota bacterium]|nr:ADP-ribosylglycohydrolase family protein [Candidatus Eremiobacteraeota bacterium]
MKNRFSGCLLGGLVGDVLGAVVESESPTYIAKHYRHLGELVAKDWVPDILGRRWRVGRYTDDTQMTLCVVDWLLAKEHHDGQALLARFAEAYRPARRYGSGVSWILRAYPDRPHEWKALSTLMFPGGSYGNGSAMRVAPIGLAFHRQPQQLVQVARLASSVTHSHPLAMAGSTLQAAAVATALRMQPPLDHQAFLLSLQRTAARLGSHDYQAKLDAIQAGLARALTPAQMASRLGTGVAAVEAVPMALYCFLSHPHHFERVIESAIFLGGDTDTIAAMAGSIAGAFLGEQAIPRAWLARVREDEYPPGRIRRLAHQLSEDFGASSLR